MSKSKLLTTAEVAERLGVTRWRINALITAGRLQAERFGQIWLINERNLQSVAHRKPGRPPKSGVIVPDPLKSMRGEIER